MPLYSFGNSSFGGFGRIDYKIAPYNNLIRLATLTLEATQLGAPGNQNYRKLKTGVEINFRSKSMTSPLSHKLTVSIPN